MKKKLLTGLATGIFLFGMVGMTQAAIINISLGEYNSPYWTGADTEYNVGTFNFNLLGESIIYATINGSWGNSTVGTTAHNFLELDGIEVANTNNYTPSPYNTTNVNWSYTFSDFSIFGDGSAVFDVTQTSESYVRLASTYLTIETSPVPEPGTMVLFGLGLAGLVGYKSRKNKK